MVDTKPIGVINEVDSNMNFKKMDSEKSTSSAINTKSTWYVVTIIKKCIACPLLKSEHVYIYIVYILFLIS